MAKAKVICLERWCLVFDVEELQKAVGFEAQDAELLRVALCHKSYAKEQGLEKHNEKLEFLGDAVLDLVIADLLMQKFGQDKEGNLSRKRASVVNEDRLCELAVACHLPSFILLGKSEKKTQYAQQSTVVGFGL